MVDGDAPAQLSSSVTSSGTNPAEAPDAVIVLGGAPPLLLEQITDHHRRPGPGQRFRHSGPEPRAPPVTNALRPVRSKTPMQQLL